MSARIITGDCLATLRTLPAASVQCCVTSPPHYGLRSYLPDVVRLKPTLTDKKRAAVIAELAALGVMGDALTAIRAIGTPEIQAMVDECRAKNRRPRGNLVPLQVSL